MSATTIEMRGFGLPQACLSCHADIPCKANLLHALLSQKRPRCIDPPNVVALNTLHHAVTNCSDILQHEWQSQVSCAYSRISWNTSPEDASAYIQLILYGGLDLGIHETTDDPMENGLPLSASLLLSAGFGRKEFLQKPSAIPDYNLHVPVPIVANISGHRIVPQASKQASYPCFAPVHTLDDSEYDTLTQLSCQLITDQLLTPEKEDAKLASMHSALAPFLLNSFPPQSVHLPGSQAWHKLPTPLVPNITHNSFTVNDDHSNVKCSLPQLPAPSEVQNRSSCISGLHQWQGAASGPECEAAMLIEEACDGKIVLQTSEPDLVTVALQHESTSHVSVRISAVSEAKRPASYKGVIPGGLMKLHRLEMACSS
jgi:hypothetical protein